MAEQTTRGLLDGDRLAIPLQGGKDVIAVDVHAWIGPFAIHRRIHHRAEMLDGWTVTHIASGRAIWTVAHFTQAMQVAQWLDQHKRIPEDLDGCLAWAATMQADRVAYTRFVAELSELSPRYITP